MAYKSVKCTNCLKELFTHSRTMSAILHDHAADTGHCEFTVTVSGGR